MEEELRCPVCRNFLRDPILLHCAHSYCRECAIGAQIKVSPTSVENTGGSGAALFSPPPCTSDSAGTSDSISLCVSDADQTEWMNDDKSSVFSETDSGVVIYAGSRGSRPSSFLGLSSAGANVVTPPRSGSIVGIGSGKTPPKSNIPSILSPSTSGFMLTCEACRKPSFFPDENFLRNVKENLAIRRLLQKYESRRSSAITNKKEERSEPNLHNDHSLTVQSPTCQWCESQSPNAAQIYCENCGYFYCDSCQPIIHPPRGPLKTHCLVPASSVTSSSTSGSSHTPFENGTLNRRLTICAQNANVSAPSTSSQPSILKSHSTSDCDFPREQVCDLHADEVLTMFCEVCRIAICAKCLSGAETRHTNHEIQSLASAVKSQKTELSQTLQLLSEKAKAASEDISKLKLFNEKISNNCTELKLALNREFDNLVHLIEQRRQMLLEVVDSERDKKRSALREQVTKCSQHLGKTTALIQFSIELLKEPDPIIYLQIGNALANRVTNQEFLWSREMRSKPEVDANFVLTLDANCAQLAIQRIEFTQFKDQPGCDSTIVPPAPGFEAAECSAENNTVVLVWHCPKTTAKIGGYSLEIDSGWDDGAFKEVYSGAENACTIDGLHFNTLYNARVKAFNEVGESAYSEPICLQTAHVAWFHLTHNIGGNGVENNDKNYCNELAFNSDCSTVSGTTMEYRTCMGSVSFSRGIHYWEVTVERCEGNADIVLGVAQSAVDPRLMLGKDLHGWSMYIDAERSWFLHNDDHHGRKNSGLASTGAPASVVGAVIGVRMDCDSGMLSFFINDTHLSTCGFKNMPRGLYYPAFSINRNATIKIHTGLQPPPLQCATLSAAPLETSKTMPTTATKRDNSRTRK